MTNRMYFFFISTLLIGMLLFLWLFAIRLDTQYIPMQIWMDGEYMGETPRLIFVFDDTGHDLELRSDKTLTVKYPFHRSSTSNFLTIDPFLEEAQKNSSPTSLGWLTGNFLDGVYLVNMRDPTKRKIIFAYPRPINDPWGTYKDKPYGLASETPVSANGEYALWHTDTAFWLTALSNADDPQEIFDEYSARIIENAHEKSLLDMGFSPDGQSIWVTGDDFFSVASITDSQKPLLHFGASNFAWSDDGQWLAVYEYEDHLPLQIFHHQAGVWAAVAELQAGIPKAFTRDGKYLWMVVPAEEGTDLKNSTLQRIDLDGGSVETSIEVGGQYVDGPVQSLDGKFFAFTYTDVNSMDPNQQSLLIVDSAGNIIHKFSNMDYSGAPVWLRGDNSLAVRVFDKDDGYQIVIVDMELHQP